MLKYTIDNPHVRNDTICPLCRKRKDTGLVLCWPCHHKEKVENFDCYSQTTETIIEAREYLLERWNKAS